MGTLFQKAECYIHDIGPRDVFVEIGTASFRAGSTHYLANLAGKLGTVLHTVDIDDRQHVVKNLPNVQLHRARGSEWTKQIFPTLSCSIACLYLDNYDYNYWTDDQCDMIMQQRHDYLQKHNIHLSNQDCVVEHLVQMINLLPFMSDQGMIICDDTYLHNDCWIGKCGAVVPYLIANGYKIIETGSIDSDGYGVILSKKWNLAIQ